MYLGWTGDAPIELRVEVGTCSETRSRDPWIIYTIASSLENKHADGGVLGQAIGDHQARCAAPDDNVVVLLTQICKRRGVNGCHGMG